MKMERENGTIQWFKKDALEVVNYISEGAFRLLQLLMICKGDILFEIP